MNHFLTTTTLPLGGSALLVDASSFPVGENTSAANITDFSSNAYWNRMVYCDSDDKKSYFEDYEKAIYGILLVLTMFGATLGNSLVVIVVLTNQSMRGATNMFLLSLAVADFMVGCLMAPLAFYTMINECWRLGQIGCTINSFLNSTLLVTSIHTLMYISIYKCLRIYRISRGNFAPMSEWTWKLMIAAAWFWGLCLAILTTNVLSTAVYKSKTMQCGPPYPYLVTSRVMLLHCINQLINLGVPVGILIFCYVLIYCRIRTNAAESCRIRVNDGTHSHTKQEKGVITTLIIVLLCFVMCWLPYVVYTNYAASIGQKGDIPTFLNPLVSAYGTESIRPFTPK